MKKTFTNLRRFRIGFASQSSEDSGKNKQVRIKTILFAFAILCSCFLQAQTPTATVQVPATGSNSIPCGQITELMDDGGTSNYSSNSDGLTTITPGVNAQINLSGPFDVEHNFDYIFIWEGVGNTGALLATFNGTGNMNWTSLPGQTITVEFTSDPSVTHSGFDLIVTFPGGCSTAPCFGTPVTNSVIPMFVNPICPNSAATMSLATPYGPNYGITIQWQTSTVSPVGQWTNVSANSGTSIFTTTDTSIPGSETYYSAIITCTNGNSSTQAISTDVMVAAASVSTVPYYEGFEELVHNGDLPNCSWVLDPEFSTFTVTPQFQAFYGNNSQNFLAFDESNASTNTTEFAYSNGIQLYPGVTYSASLWYLTNAFPEQGVDNVAISLNTSQTPNGATVIAQSPNEPFAPVYKSLSDTFSVSSPGIYYLLSSVTRDNTFAFEFIAIDDISIIAPCDLNTPTVSISGATAVCLGSPINLTASGADTYSWSTGTSNTSITIPTSQAGQMSFMVVATNTAAGCSVTVNKPVNVLAGPLIAAFTSNPANGVCPGSVATLYAVGSAISYTWNTTTIAGANVTVAPTSNTTYTVVGTNATNCLSSATIAINALQAPSVSGSASKQLICAGESVTLTGNDASLTYSWVANAYILTGSPITTMPAVATTYVLYGTDPNTGCTGTAVISVNVDKCLGISTLSASDSGIVVYPNPNNGEFTVELNSGAIASIQIVDFTGRVLMTSTTSDGKATINISSLANGVYYVKTKSSDKTSVMKVVKQ